MKAYDSFWVRAYVSTLAYLQSNAPEKLQEFVTEVDRLKVRATFREKKIHDLFTREVSQKIKVLISQLSDEQLEQHELFRFGRLVVHNLDYFNHLQKEMCSRISEIVGEALEPSYNFLSLYNNLGVCDLHQDAPESKWTVDYCIEQSTEWPIQISAPEDWATIDANDSNWKQQVTSGIDFTSYNLNPTEALVFGGSSQWHFRDRIPRVQNTNFCHLVFFHFIPLDCKEMVSPANWASILNEPELVKIVQPFLDEQ